MKPNASVLVIAGTLSLAALVGITVACSQSSVTETPVASTSAAPIAAASASASPASPAPVATPKTSVQKQTTALTPSPSATEVAPSPVAVNRTIESCVVTMALVDDPKPPLNVRSAPTAEGDNVVGQLKNGTYLTIANDQNGWLQIKTPLKGWIAKGQTQNGCNQKVERISLSADGTTVQVADRFIGTGSHRYRVSAKQGQRLTINHDRGPFPRVIAPDGTVLLDHEQDDTRSTWNGQLAQTGDYIVELESNFKGYRYAFSIQVK